MHHNMYIHTYIIFVTPDHHIITRTASDEWKGYTDICTLNLVPPSVPKTIFNSNALLHRPLHKSQICLFVRGLPNMKLA